MAKSKEAAEQLVALVQQIRNDIVFGAYEPGTWLKLGELQERHGASAFHIRRALDELKNLKLVDHVANAGFRVATPDEAAREETRFVRKVLERSAAPLIAAKATEEDILTLRELAAAFEHSIRSEGRRDQARANHNFHEKLYSIAGNATLSEMIKELRSRSHQATTGRWRSSEGLEESNAEHYRIIAAIAEHDPYELERVIVGHIESF